MNKKESFYESQIFRFIILIFLSMSLIEGIFIVSGFLINKYFFNIIGYFEYISWISTLIVIALIIIGKYYKLKNSLLLRVTFFSSLLTSILISLFSK